MCFCYDLTPFNSAISRVLNSHLLQILNQEKRKNSLKMKRKWYMSIVKQCFIHRMAWVFSQTTDGVISFDLNVVFKTNLSPFSYFVSCSRYD